MKLKLIVLLMTTIAMAQTMDVIPLTPSDMDKRKVAQAKFDSALKEYDTAKSALDKLEASIMAAHGVSLDKPGYSSGFTTVFSKDGKYLIKTPQMRLVSEGYYTQGQPPPRAYYTYDGCTGYFTTR